MPGEATAVGQPAPAVATELEVWRRAGAAQLEIARALGGRRDVAHVLRIVAHQAARALGAARCSIYLVDAGGLVPAVAQLADGRADVGLWRRLRALRAPRPEEVPAVAEAMRSRAPVAVHDAAAGGLVPPAWVTALGLRSMLCVPLLAGDAVVGVMNLDRPDASAPWTADEIDQALAIGHQAALTVEAARAARRGEERARRLATLAALAGRITGARTSEEVCRAVAESAVALLGARLARVWVADPDAQVHRLVASAGDGAARAAAGRATLAWDEGIVGAAFAAGAPVYLTDYHRDERAVSAGLARTAGLHACAALPLSCAERTAGVLLLLFAHARPFSGDERELMELLAAYAAIAVRNARLVDEAERRRQEAEAARAEAERAARALEQSEAWARALIRDAPCGIVRVSATGAFLDVNPAFARMLGCETEEEVRALGLSAIFAEPGGRARLLNALRRHGTVAGLEVAWRRRDGTPITARLAGRAVRGAGGAVESFELIAEDVTERRLLEEQLWRAQKMEAIGQLAGGIAHDFNNLLSVVSGRAQLLLRALRGADPARREVAVIRAAADRAARLTRQLLAIARRQPLAPRLVDLNAVVTGMAPLLRRFAGEHIEIVTAPAAGLGAVLADPAQMEQVLLNLVANARDAMPAGGRVRIATANADLDTAFVRQHPGSRAGAHVVLEVADTGVGMDARTRARIFEPFFTTKAPGLGTGLGLSTVYGIVRQHGGFIDVESAPGRGTVFRVYLARVLDTAPAPPVRRRQTAMAAGHGTLLIVEDERRLLALERDVLLAAGYAVLTARGGREALDAAARFGRPIDLLVTDVVMPGLSGVDVARRLRARQPDLRVLYVSGYPAPLEGLSAAEQAADALLAKPFTPEELTRAVRSALASART